MMGVMDRYWIDAAGRGLGTHGERYVGAFERDCVVN